MLEMLASIPPALSVFADGLTWLFFILGFVLGLVFGAIPGLSGAVCLALLIPVSWGMEPRQGMVMFAGVMGAVAFGGAIPAILLNVPGTAPNVATCFDGYPLTQKGKAGVALGAAAVASGLGAIFGIIWLILLIPAIRLIILRVGPPETFIFILFGLFTIALFVRGNFIKGLFSGGLGLLLAFVGYDPLTGAVRYNFGTLYLYDGVRTIPVIIGVFAITEAISMCIQGGAVAKVKNNPKASDVWDGVKAVFKYKLTLLRSSVIGTCIGIIPGVGGTVACLMAWMAASQSSPRKAFFGTGEVEGVIASEAANDAKDGGALLPTLAFGIPGSAEMAVLLGAFVLHGLVPGPQLLSPEGLPIIWCLILSLLFSNILVSTVGLLLAKHLAKLSMIRANIIAPIIFCISLMGAYSIHFSIYDSLLALIAGFVGYLMVVYGFSRITLVLGLVLGTLAERSFHQSLMISDVGGLIFLTRPIAFAFVLVLIVTLTIPVVRRLLKKK
ncbi:tripartite tricarboxylate transporter permease [Thermodesulfobacteriota bacterium]